MAIKTVADINQYSGSSVNPLEYPEQLYELYSVPSFETGYPEIVKGKDIGSTKITVEEGDVLVCKINPRINRVWVVKHNTEYPLLASSEWIVVRNRNIDSNYLKWYFSSPTFRTLLNSHVAGIGGSLTRAQPKQVAKYPVPVSSHSEQQKVSENLDKVNELIALRKEQLAKLDQLVKSRFIEMFGDPVSNSKNLPELTLPELGEFGRGVSKHRPRNDPKLLGGEYPLIQTGEVANSELYITSFENTYSELGLKQSKMWKSGTLCITIAANIAKTAILTFDACFPDSVVGFKANDKTNNIFIHYWFSFFQAILEAQAPESAQKNINLKVLSELKIIVPPIEQQNKFVAFVEQTDKSKLTIQASLDKLELLKKNLMQEYFG